MFKTIFKLAKFQFFNMKFTLQKIKYRLQYMAKTSDKMSDPKYQAAARAAAQSKYLEHYKTPV